MAATNQDIAQALRYGPKTAGLVRRSAYLDDALRAMSAQGGQNIQSPGELAARLVATAILSRASGKARDATTDAIRMDQQSESQRLIDALRPKASPMAMPGVGQASAPQAVDRAAMGPAVPPLAQLPAQQSQPQSAPASFNPGDPNIDAIVRTVFGEARGEDPTGQAAVASVILNRAKERGLTPSEVVFQKGQFEPWGNPATRARLQSLDVNSPEYQAVLRNIMPALQGQSPVGGADHFYSPGAQSAMGRAPPKWDNGRGTDMGRHRFFDLERGAPDAQPYQVASLEQPGQLPPMPAPQALPEPTIQQASAPGSSPPADGPPPAASPQAAAGGNPAQQWPTYQPSEAEIGYVQELLANPQTFEQGRAEAMKLRAKMAQPAEASIETINGVPFYVSKVPGQGGQPVMIPVPREAQTQNAPAEQFGVAAPRGTIMSRDPLGNMKTVVAPQQGQQVASNPGEAYRETFVPGGTNDPFRVQAPTQGYAYAQGPGGLRQEAIPGSSADLKNPANVMDGANRYGGMVKTIVDSAMKVKQNYGAVQAGFRQQNGTGDIAMINGLQKLIDEGVVKGEDVTMQMKSNGLDGTLGSYAQYLQSGGLLTPEIRNRVNKTATDLYQNLDNTYRVRIQSLAPGFDEAYGPGAFGRYVFPDAFAAELGWTGETPRKPEPPRADPPAAAIQRYQSMKIDPSKPWGDRNRPFLARDADTLKGLDRPENRGKFVITPDGSLAVID